MTFNEHGNEMLEQIADLQAGLPEARAARDLALAKTHLEDALTRYNSSRYHMLGTWQRRDPDGS